jgi:hypothetical protein
MMRGRNCEKNCAIKSLGQRNVKRIQRLHHHAKGNVTDMAVGIIIGAAFTPQLSAVWWPI